MFETPTGNAALDCNELNLKVEIDSLACQLAALHGLGHLRHPATESAITKYLERNPDLSEQNRKFALACIAGEIE